MNLTTRISDYGIVGTFFLFLQLLIFVPPATLFFLWEDIGILKQFVSALQHFSDNTPEIFRPAVTGVIGIFSILSIFLIGVIIDIMGFAMIPLELQLFIKNVSQNSDWLSRLATQNIEYLSKDYTRIHKLGEYYKPHSKKPFSRDWRRRIKLIKSKKVLQFIKDDLSPVINNAIFALNFFPALKSFSRVQDFFICYAFECSNAKDYAYFVDRMRIWSFCRNFTTAMFIPLAEILFIILVVPRGSNLQSYLPTLLLMGMLIFFLGFISLYITKRAYARVCHTLFSVIYISFKRIDEDSCKVHEPTI